MVIKTTRKISLSSLKLFLNEWSLKAYRIKGFVNLKEKITVAVQCNFNLVEIVEIANDFHPTELVAITDQFSLHEWNSAFKELG